jgi:molybdopterin synthase catalytic subunit
MHVTVLYFATLRDLTGERREAIELTQPATLADLKRELQERHPAIEPSLETALFAINREYAFPDDALENGDEVAVFPPVSGGREDPIPGFFQITDEPLDMNEVLTPLIRPTTGAACVFTGMVREVTERGQARKTDHLQYEAYRPMAEAKMKQVALEIRERWPSIEGIAIVQRVGRLEPGTPTVLIACTAAHRDSGVFEAARYGIDRLKEIVPIWKKEVGSQGETWVEGEYQPDVEDRA